MSGHVETAEDFIRGNPEDIVVGKQEKAAKIHRPQNPKPKLVKSATTIKRDIDRRLNYLREFVDEYEVLERAAEALKKIR